MRVRGAYAAAGAGRRGGETALGREDHGAGPGIHDAHRAVLAREGHQAAVVVEAHVDRHGLRDGQAAHLAALLRVEVAQRHVLGGAGQQARHGGVKVHRADAVGVLVEHRGGLQRS